MDYTKDTSNYLSIIIPVYNEQESISDLIDRIIASREVILKGAGLVDLEIITVDDGSSDRTASILASYSDKVTVLTHDINRGYGAALKTGFANARGEYLSFLDADGTCNPESFINMVNKLRESGAQIAVGSRMDKDKSEMPAVRWIGNKFFATLLTFFSGKKVTDSASGMRVFKKEILKSLYPLPDGLHFTPAMTTKALHEGMQIVEIAVPYAERGGKSKLSVFKDGYRFLKIIMDTVLMYNPFKVFALIGLLSIFVASLLAADPIYELMSPRDFVFSDYIYRSIGALYFFIAGVQIILFGVLARFIVSNFFKRYEVGRFIHWVNARFHVYHNIGWYGFLPFLTGVGINFVYFYKWIFGKGLSLHWAFLLLAAGLIIIGLQMFITGIVIKLLTNISDHIFHNRDGNV